MSASMRHNVAWSMTSIVAKNGCQIVTYMLLARLLDPASFGCIAITMVGMGLAYSLVDSGFTNVVVRQQSLDRDMLSSLYWFNITLGIFAAVLLAAAGYCAGAFYHNQQLVRLMATAGVAIVCSAYGQQFMAILQRSLAFRTLSAIEMGSAFVAMVVAVSRALSGVGPLAYFEGLVVGNAFASILAVAFGRRHFFPTFRFRAAELRKLLQFGLFNTAERSIGYISFNLEKLIMGRLFSLELLGLYTVVNQLVTRPVMFFSAALSRVAYPVYATLQGEFSALNILYIGYTAKLALVVFPIYGFLILFPDTIITLLFGKQFTAAHVFALPLCILGALWSIGNPFGSYLMALNRAKIGFVFNAGAALLTLVVFLAGSRYSLQTMLWIWVGAVIGILLPIEWTIRHRLTGMSAWRYAASFLPHALAVAALSIVVYFIRSLPLHAPVLVETIVEMAVFSLLYAGYGILMYKRYQRQNAGRT
jgi:O-antigen/teichoic acid export membrane protein